MPITDEEEARASIWYDRCKRFSKEAGFGESFRSIKETIMLQACYAKRIREKQELIEARTKHEWGTF